MGRLESLTAWALGRTPYEEEVIISGDGTQANGQQYSENGRPRNPETKRRERESVRAANEVMQTTGVVVDVLAAKEKILEYREKKMKDTLDGLRLMEAGRAVLVGGVWGVLGLRRRILIYKSYAQIGFLDILRNEHKVKSVSSMFLSGIPTVIAYHISDYAGFIVQALIDDYLDEEETEYTPRELWFKHAGETMVDVFFCYITLHFRMFAILQQLNLIPGSRLLPSLRSFIPLSSHSPLQLPSHQTSFTSLTLSLLRSVSPMLIILLHGRAKFYISKLLYRPIYKTLPRPTGDSMFSGLDVSAPDMEYDAPDRVPTPPPTYGEDAPTLRALEGRPALEVHDEREEEPMQVIASSMEQRDDATDEEDEEMRQATLVSFDVQATNAPANTAGNWSAELRNANEPKQPDGITYRVTGLTMLPTILATEGLREIVAGFLVIPLEAVMVRIIGRAYLQSGGSSISNLYEIFSFREVLPAWESIFGAFAIQVAVTGVVWGAFTFGALWRTSTKKNPKEEMEEGDTLTS